jgi:outer membrane protein
MYNVILKNKINKMGKKLMLTSLVLLIFIAPNVLNAQKVGHVNFQEIILLMPEYTMAATEYDLYQAALEDDLKAVENMIMEVQKNYEIESQKPAPNKTKMKIYMQQNESYQQEYQMLQQSSQDSLKAKMAELVAPIKKKVEEAVSAIAIEKGYSHIIDNSYGTLIYADPTANIDAAVKTKLNLKEKPAANTGAGKPATPTTPK